MVKSEILFSQCEKEFNPKIIFLGFESYRHEPQITGANMPKDLTYAIQAFIAEQLSHGVSRSEIEKLVYQMRQRAMMEEEGGKVFDVPPDDDPTPPKDAA
jgi:hypothetical protein